jgi:hypothetical protein
VGKWFHSWSSPTWEKKCQPIPVHAMETQRSRWILYLLITNKEIHTLILCERICHYFYLVLMACESQTMPLGRPLLTWAIIDWWPMEWLHAHSCCYPKQLCRKSVHTLPQPKTKKSLISISNLSKLSWCIRLAIKFANFFQSNQSTWAKDVETKENVKLCHLRPLLCDSIFTGTSAYRCNKKALKSFLQPFFGGLTDCYYFTGPLIWF